MSHHREPGQWPVFTVNVPPSLAGQLRRACSSQRLTANDIIREALRRYTADLLDDTNRETTREPRST
jgi:hypothetical protein